MKTGKHTFNTWLCKLMNSSSLTDFGIEDSAVTLDRLMLYYSVKGLYFKQVESGSDLFHRKSALA